MRTLALAAGKTERRTGGMRRSGLGFGSPAASEYPTMRPQHRQETPVGMLVYNGRMTLPIDDRVLAHLQVVVINKLRRRESFTFTSTTAHRRRSAGSAPRSRSNSSTRAIAGRC